MHCAHSGATAVPDVPQEGQEWGHRAGWPGPVSTTLYLWPHDRALVAAPCQRQHLRPPSPSSTPSPAGHRRDPASSDQRTLVGSLGAQGSLLNLSPVQTRHQAQHTGHCPPAWYLGPFLPTAGPSPGSSRVLCPPSPVTGWQFLLGGLSDACRAGSRPPLCRCRRARWPRADDPGCPETSGRWTQERAREGPSVLP